MVWKPHATVAAVIEKDGTYLMVQERIDGEIVINQPAGHLDDNESQLDAIIREVKEETAWTFKPLGIVGIYQWRHPTQHHTHVRSTYFGTVSDHDPQQTLDVPIISADWYTREQLEDTNLRSTMVLTCIDHYINGHRYPLSLIQNVAS